MPCSLVHASRHIRDPLPSLTDCLYQGRRKKPQSGVEPAFRKLQLMSGSP